MCHNLRHETLVICREVQKQNLISASLLLLSLYFGHCTSIIAKRRNKGYWRKLSDEFPSCIGQEGFTFTDHNPGHDASKCARLFLYYNDASVVSDVSSAKSSVKKCRLVE